MLKLAALIATALVAGTSSATVVARIKIAPGTQPCAAAGGGGAVWVSDYGAPFLLKIDPKSNKVVRKIGIGSGSCGLGYGAGSLWIEDTSSNTVSRVSARTGKRIKAIDVGNQPYDATFAYGSAWVTSNSDGDVERIDPAKNAVVRKWPVAGAVGVVASHGAIWVGGSDGVTRIDPVGGATVKIPIAAGAGWTAATADAVWVTSKQGLARIDPQTNAVTLTVPLKGNIGDPDVVGGKVWAPEINQNDVAIVDPADGSVTRLKVGTGPFVITQIRGEAWIPSWKGTDIWRVRP
jgi:hypothetical protein